jgi:hypothetical protein
MKRGGGVLSFVEEKCSTSEESFRDSISKETNKTTTINYRYQAGYEYYVLSLIFGGVRRRPQKY